MEGIGDPTLPPIPKKPAIPDKPAKHVSKPEVPTRLNNPEVPPRLNNPKVPPRLNNPPAFLPKQAELEVKNTQSVNNKFDALSAPVHFDHISPNPYPYDDDDRVYEKIQVTSRKKLCEIIHDKDDLPVRVAFCESIYGMLESFTFYGNELFDILFMKESVVANVLMSQGETKRIPLHANFEFILAYPSSDLNGVQADYTVSEIMKLSRLPKVAVVKKGCFKKGKKSLGFADGEILILRNRNKSKSIECTSVLCKTKKTIDKSLTSLVLTTANVSQMRFSFVDLIYFDYPLQVKIIAPLRMQHVFAHHDSTITGLIKEKSFIASFSDIKKRKMNAELYEIFADVPIDFQLAQNSEQQKAELVKKSTDVFETFTPANICKVILNTNDKLQTDIYETYSTRGFEEWKNVIELLPNEHLKKSANLEKNSLPFKQNIVEVEYEQIIPNPCQLHPKLVHPKLSLKSTASNMSSSIKKHSSFNVEYHQDKIRRPTSRSFSTSIDTIPVKKRMKLEDLSCDQVLDLLDKIGLAQYKGLFITEKISGGLLSELDADILEHELGITSKLHRLKLIRIIEGRESIELLLI